MYTTLISTEEVASHLTDPNWAIVDCRFELTQSEWGFRSYQEGHIAGSVYAHLDRDLAGPITPQTGRHPLPDVDRMAERLGNWGIENNTQVVVYDTSGGAFAARLWWQLRFLGHRAAALLDGGFQKWQLEGRPTAAGVETRSPAPFIPHPDWTMVADVAEVERIREDSSYRLIDARAPERFWGEREPIDPVAGHIPGAVNRFHGANLGADGTFLPAETLRAQFHELLDAVPPQQVVVYCGSGVTSIHHLIAMELAGLHGARLYPGSWSEWIRDPDRPIAKS